MLGIIIIIIVLSILPKIICGYVCFICILYPDSLCRIHYVYCICIKGSDDPCSNHMSS